LRDKVENNIMLLKSIASSQDHLDIESKIKQVMKLSTQLQKENEQQDMTQEEIREIAKDVISEIEKNQKR
jgi:polysaccharide pyruvyl transferase WcaK-like protein